MITVRVGESEISVSEDCAAGVAHWLAAGLAQLSTEDNSTEALPEVRLSKAFVIAAGLRCDLRLGPGCSECGADTLGHEKCPECGARNER